MALIDLNKCGCGWEEIPNLIKDSPVKSYVKKTECAACQTKREAAETSNGIRRKEREDAQLLQEKRQETLNKIADAEIAKNG